MGTKKEIIVFNDEAHHCYRSKPADDDVKLTGLLIDSEQIDSDDGMSADFEKCHVSHVALDSDWKAKFAQSIEEMPEVIAYVKNQGDSTWLQGT